MGRRRSSGFSLIEIVIAMAVLAIALTGIMAAISNNMAFQEIDRQTGLARDAAISKLDEVRAVIILDDGTSTYDQLAVLYPQNVVTRELPPAGNYFPVTGLRWGAQPFGNSANVGKVILYPTGTGEMVDCHVEVNFSSAKGSRTHRMSILVTR